MQLKLNQGLCAPQQRARSGNACLEINFRTGLDVDVAIFVTAPR